MDLERSLQNGVSSKKKKHYYENNSEKSGIKSIGKVITTTCHGSADGQRQQEDLMVIPLCVYSCNTWQQQIVIVSCQIWTTSTTLYDGQIHDQIY